MTAASSTSLAELLEALRQWLLANPNGDLQDFAAEHDTTPQELAEGWNTYFAQADFSRNYDLDTTTSQSGAQGATQAAAQAAPVYTPSSPPPYNASPDEYAQYLTQEVNNFQEFTTINNITNNIEDNSFNQQIIAGGDVDQDIDIDNSENTAEDGGVIIDDSELDDVNVNTGDVGEEGVLQQGDGNVANTGDVNASDGSAGSVFGDATTIGSGNDNFGSGQQGVNVAVGDGNQQANQQQDNETTIELDDVDVTGGDANADGGDGGVGGAGSGGDGGSGGEGGDGDGGFPFGPGGDGGDGGAGGAGGAGTGGSADGGAGGTAEGGDAGIDIDASNNQDIDF